MAQYARSKLSPDFTLSQFQESLSAGFPMPGSNLVPSQPHPDSNKRSRINPYLGLILFSFQLLPRGVGWSICGHFAEVVIERGDGSEAGY